MLNVLSCILAVITSVTEIPNPRTSHVWVTDMIDLIPAEVEARLNAKLDKLHQDLSVEVTIVAIDDLAIQTPKDFATSLFRYWGIGQKGVDNGLLFLVVRDKRRLEMETGYGLEKILSSEWLSEMQGKEMVPEFKKKRYGAGLEAGVLAVEERLRADAAASPVAPSPVTPTSATPTSATPVYAPPLYSPTSSSPPRSTAGSLRAERSSSSWVDYVFYLSLVVFAISGVVLGRRSVRRCSACKTRMALLPESEEDVHLSKKQQIEEGLGTILYDVYQCPACQRVEIFYKEGRGFSSYSYCPKCDAKTFSLRSKVLRAATEKSEGLLEIDQRCANCQHHLHDTRPLARRSIGPSRFVGSYHSHDSDSSSHSDSSIHSDSSSSYSSSDSSSSYGNDTSSSYSSSYSDSSSSYSNDTSSSSYSSDSSSSSSSYSDSSSSSSSYSDSSSSSSSDDSSKFGGGDTGGGGTGSSW